MEILFDLQIKVPSVLRTLVLGDDARDSSDCANILDQKRIKGLRIGFKLLTSKTNSVTPFIFSCWLIEFIIT